MNWYCKYDTWVAFYVAQKINVSNYSTLNISFSRSEMSLDEPIRWGIMSTASADLSNFCFI